ncbi:MAG: hypothetical protein GX684_00840 [Ruminococcaceae bacterium]|nr:hypothetical protein [Oscillospiraceae bacterium]
MDREFRERRRPKYRPDNERRINKRRRRVAIPFFVVLFMLFAVSLIIPLRPKDSPKEKRELTKFPKFSVTTLLSGEFFGSVNLWFSDTFPGRDAWIASSDFVKRFYGNSDVAVKGAVGNADEIPEFVGKDDGSVAPNPDGSGSGSAAKTPEPGSSAEPTQTPAPTKAPDENVKRWEGFDGNAEAKIAFGNVIQIGDSAYAYFGFIKDACDRHADIVNRCSDMLAGHNAKLFDFLAPTGIGIVLSSDFMKTVNSSDQGKTISYIFSKVNDNVGKVNMFNTLIAHNTEYLYFRTDHHWSALGAYYGYTKFCSVAGFKAVPLAEFTPLDQGEFLGSFYSTSPSKHKLRADNVMSYKPPGNIKMTVTDHYNNTYEAGIIQNMKDRGVHNKYLSFIAGDHPFIHIENKDLTTAPNCVVIKDSFGNPVVPYLTQHYKNIYVIDYRKYKEMSLSELVKKYDVSHVILMESLAMAQGKGAMDLIESICR